MHNLLQNIKCGVSVTGAASLAAECGTILHYRALGSEE